MLRFAAVALSLVVLETQAQAACTPVEPASWTTYSSVDQVTYKLWKNDNCVVNAGDDVHFVMEARTGDRSRARGQGYARWVVTAPNGGLVGLSPNPVNAGPWPNINSGWPRFTREYQKNGWFTAVTPGIYEVTAEADFPYATYTPFANKNARFSKKYRVVVKNPLAQDLVGKTFINEGFSWVEPTAAAAWIPEGVWLHVVSASEDGAQLTVAVGLADTCDVPGPTCVDGLSDYTCVDSAQVFPVALGLDGHLSGAIDDLTVFAEGAWINYEDFAFSADLGPAGTLANVSLSGLTDTRTVDGLLGVDSCDLFAFGGDPCVPCTDGAIECSAFEVNIPTAVPTPMLVDVNKDASVLAECAP